MKQFSIFLTIVMFVFGPISASALVMIGDDAYGGGGTVFNAPTTVYGFNIDKNTYAPGEIISISGSAVAAYCANSTGNLTVTAVIQEIGAPIISLISEAAVKGNTTRSGSGTVNAPSTPGSYNMLFTVTGVVTGKSGNGAGLAIGTTVTRTASVPFTVVATAQVTPPSINLNFSFLGSVRLLLNRFSSSFLVNNFIRNNEEFFAVK